MNFEQGEVIYENTRVLEWIKFIQTFGLTFGSFIALYVPFSLGFKTNLVTDAADELTNIQYHLVSPTTVDILRLSVPVGMGAIAYTVYGLMNYTNTICNQYVVKMSYSKDKVKIYVREGIGVCEASGLARNNLRRSVRSSALGNCTTSPEIRCC
jgi:hypothetical protein